MGKDILSGLWALVGKGRDAGYVALVAALLGLPLSAHAKDTRVDPSQLEPLAQFRECDVCPEMIVLPLGDFLMGAPPGESKLNVHIRGQVYRPVTPDDPYIAEFEGPVHKVTIDLPIAMARNELTYRDWNACLEDGGCGGYEPPTSIWAARAEWRDGEVVALRPEHIELGEGHPAILLSFHDIQLYLQWLNEKAGADVYRLPTEAEWEYAARAGTQTPFAQGDEITTDQANFLGRATEVMLGERRPDLLSRGHPVPVDELDAANAWGLRHMSGNLFERTMSCWTDRHAGWALSSIHLEMARDRDCIRVARGGGYSAAMDYARLGYRGRVRDSHRSKLSGFRIVRDLNSKQGK